MTSLKLEEWTPQRESEMESEQENDGATLELLPELPIFIKPGSLTTPSEFSLGSLRDGRLRIVEPLRVSWKAEGGGIVLEAYEINEFGFGDNMSEAIADLQIAIAELYLALDADQENLGHDLAALRETLTRKIRMADVYLRS